VPVEPQVWQRGFQEEVTKERKYVVVSALSQNHQSFTGDDTQLTRPGDICND
jgi:hypothetical protein